MKIITCKNKDKNNKNKECGYVNFIHDYDKKVVLDGMLTIVSGGFWLLLKLIKDGIMWSFDGGKEEDVGVFESKHKCRKCGKELQK